MCETFCTTVIPSSLQSAVMLWSLTLPNGSGSSSKLSAVVPHSLNSFGKASAGWPLITKSLEFKFLRLRSRSSRHWSRNLVEQNTAMILCLLYLCYFIQTSTYWYRHLLSLRTKDLIRTRNEMWWHLWGLLVAMGCHEVVIPKKRNPINMFGQRGDTFICVLHTTSYDRMEFLQRRL